MILKASQAQLSTSSSYWSHDLGELVCQKTSTKLRLVRGFCQPAEPTKCLKQTSPHHQPGQEQRAGYPCPAPGCLVGGGLFQARTCSWTDNPETDKKLGLWAKLRSYASWGFRIISSRHGKPQIHDWRTELRSVSVMDLRVFPCTKHKMLDLIPSLWVGASPHPTACDHGQHFMRSGTSISYDTVFRGTLFSHALSTSDGDGLSSAQYLHQMGKSMWKIGMCLKNCI